MKKTNSSFAKKVFLGAALLAFTSTTFAGGFVGTIGTVTVQQPNYVFIDVGGHNNPPGCQGGSTDFAIDISTTLGKSQYAFVLTAKALESNVTIIGSGACDWPDREAVNYMFSD